ncbi:MAG: tyramine oxidase, partial [Bacteroidota bacterium]
NGPVAHPLDGLTAEEYERVTEILRNGDVANEETLYPLIELLEPDKSVVLAWQDGDAVDRRATAHFKIDDGFQSAVVNITQGMVEEVGPSGGQPMVLFAEFITAMEIALSAPEMVAGLEARGLTPEDVFCLPLTAGNFMTDEYAGSRLMKVPCYLNPTGSNFYAKPIEGLFALADLGTNEVIRVVDEGAVPSPTDAWGYTEEEVAGRAELRPETNPATVTQTGDPNYTIDGSQINWDIWRFRYRIDKRPGLVLSNIDVNDKGDWRSVLYQAHLSEVFVPYMDPSAGWYWRTYMDSGEYGFGLFLTPLTAGIDCPTYATFLPALIADDSGNPLEIPDAICIFERSVGDPAWRHFEIFAQSETEFVPA